MSNQSEGQASSPFEPPPWEGQPAPTANPGQQSGAPGDPVYPTYQPPKLPDHSKDRLSGEPVDARGLLLSLLGLAVASFMWWFAVLLPLVPTVIVMTMALLVAVVGAILVGRAVAGLGRLHASFGLLAAGAAAAISVNFLLPMVIDPPWRDWWTCLYQAETLPQENACDVAYNTAAWDG